MAFVRRHGNQLAIVHGGRDPETGKVGQQVLFTLYSRAEAREVLTDEGGQWLRCLLEERFPRVRFLWPTLLEAIQREIEFLPEREDPTLRQHATFDKDLRAFTRQIALTDPQELASADELLGANQHRLEFLVRLVEWRLKTTGSQESDVKSDNAFSWRFRLRRDEVPMDVEGMATELFHDGQLDEAQAAFCLLTECFVNYAEGHNYLGLIALERNCLDEAIGAFKKTMEVGRRLFPKRIPKNRYWSDLDTRPYIRGMNNLALTLIRATRYDDALVVCDRLEHECRLVEWAHAHRSSAYLNMGNWDDAAKFARMIRDIHPSESLVVAFAEYELRHIEQAVTELLFATMNRPFAVRVVLGLKGRGPSGAIEAEDHNAGVDLIRGLPTYLPKRGRAARKFLQGVLESEACRAMRDERDKTSRRWMDNRSPDSREAFDRLREMQSIEFARRNAARIVEMLQRR